MLNEIPKDETAPMMIFNPSKQEPITSILSSEKQDSKKVTFNYAQMNKPQEYDEDTYEGTDNQIASVQAETIDLTS